MKNMDHIQYVIDSLGENLLAQVQSESANNFVREISKAPIKQIMDVFISADPTPKKTMVDWLVKAYLSKGFKWEDICWGSESKVADTLKLYKANYKKLPAADRDLYGYSELAKVYKAIQPFIANDQDEDSQSNREAKKLERAEVLKESIVLHRSSRMIVAVPLTERASKWWGRGTRWCTAADKHNMFDYYNENAPLIIVTLIDGRETTKLQLWMHYDEANPGEDISFMDSTDSRVENQLIEKYLEQLEPLLMWMIEANSMCIRYLPDSIKTLELCWRAVEQNGCALEFIPQNLISFQLRMRAVYQNVLALKFIPEEMKSIELCSTAIEQNGHALEYVPEKMKTLELCWRAVEQNTWAFIYVPEVINNPELCHKSVKMDGYLFHYVPESLKSPELCRTAVEMDGWNLELVPKEMQTSELCRIAVSNCGDALCSVPADLISIELCWLAIHNNLRIFDYIPHHLISPEICLIAVQRSGWNLTFIPESMLTDELCRVAIEQNPLAIECVPQKFLTSKLLSIPKKIEEYKVNWNLSSLDGLDRYLNKSKPL